LPRIADYTHMGCRYCGKELALLKRLTGGGEFCSEAHKRSYQDEYNRLALSRLLQAQKVQQGQSAGKKAGTSAAPVAVEERSPEAHGLDETVFAEPGLEAATAVEHALPDESLDRGADEMAEMESASIEISSLEESGTDEAALEDAADEAGLEPTEIVEFLLDAPAMATLPEETPYLESWLELSSGPAVAAWQLQDGNGANTLSTAALLSLNLQLNASPAEDLVHQPGAEANLTPQEFAAPGLGQPSLPWKVSAMHQLPYASPVTIEVAVTALDFAPDQSTAAGLDFETALSPQDSTLLSLASTAIEFPGEDSGVELAAGRDAEASVDASIAEPEPVIAEDASPRASLEALSKLHQDLIHEEEAAPEEAVAEEVVAAVVADAAQEPVLVAAEVVEPPASQQAPAGSNAGPATELLDIAIRMFPPTKPAPIAGAGLPSQSEPLLPHLKSLPLRPKVAVASGYAPPAAAPAPAAKTVPSAPKPAPPQAPTAHAASTTVPHKDGAPAAPSKFAPASKPGAARITQPKQPAVPVKAENTVKASAPAGKAQPPVQPAASKAAPPAPAPQKEPAPQPAPAPQKETAAIAATPKASPEAKPASEQPASTKPETKPPVKQRLSESAQESTPTFGSMQQPAASFAGSLKVKLGIAIVFLVVACSTWLGWGGKSSKPGANSANSMDASGPSIIMGEGGWVEGWAGDPSGVHVGRQITIYRPSLKLSDYRIEFQGSIETQSIGWVFRAADPDNYYALKLMTVSAGLSPKLALFKYLVINGRQTQVGRVPIDLTLGTDTVFNIRTDVRGPQFTTLIQGRQVDVWTDDQLKTGGVGFLNERDERAKVKSVAIRYLNGGVK
jgi:hypothetical protein